jgi:L-ascorbate metabolism protein UlaG (beta-lactamase superfamily)
MAISLTWLGHACWQIQFGATTILLDPFLDESPSAPVKANDVSADFILVSHGHFDHIADVAQIANRCNSTVVAVFEVAQWLQTTKSVVNTLGMNTGGWAVLARAGEQLARVKMTPAWHSSQLPDGSYGGNPVGFVLEADDKRIYFACDTALFSDMQLIGKLSLDAAVLPIGDLFTMGPEDSVTATQFLQPKKVLPSHYGTWPPIEQDAQAWADSIRRETAAEPIVLAAGSSTEI